MSKIDIKAGQVWIDKVTKRKIKIFGPAVAENTWITLPFTGEGCARHLYETHLRHYYDLTQ